MNPQQNLINKIISLIEMGVFSIFILVPLIFYKKSPYPFVTPKVVFFLIIVELMFILWITLLFISKAYRPRFTPLLVILIIFTSILCITSLTGVDTVKSLWGVIDRKVGVVTYIHLFALFLILTSLYEKIRWRSLSYSVVATSFLISLVAILQHFGIVSLLIPSPPTITQVTGTFSNAPFLAAYLNLTIFVGLWLFFTEERHIRKFWLLTGILLGVIALFFTEVRASIIGFWVGLMILFVYLSFFSRDTLPKTRITRVSARLVCLVILFLTVIFFSTPQAEIWKNIPGPNRLVSESSQKNFLIRYNGWQTAWAGFMERPLVGWGWDNFDVVYRKFSQPNQYQYSSPSFAIGDKPFNVLLEYLVSGGLLGLLSYLGIFIAFFYELWRTKGGHKPFLITLIAAYFIQNLAIFDTIATLPFFFLVLALVDALYKKQTCQATDEAPTCIVHGKTYAYLIASTLALCMLALTYRINVTTLKAEHYQFLSDESLAVNYIERFSFWEKALETNTPYHRELQYRYVETARVISSDLPFEERLKVLHKAAQTMETLTKKYPEKYDFILMLADTYNSIAFYEDRLYAKKAENILKQATALAPFSPDAYIILGKTRLLMGDEEGAIAALEKAHELDTKLSDPRVILAIFYFQVNELEKGGEEITNILELGIYPKYAEENILLGDSQIRNKKNKNAALFYEQALIREQSHNTLIFTDVGLSRTVTDIAIKIRLALAYYNDGDKLMARNILISVDQTIKIIKDDLGGYLEYMAMFKELGFSKYQNYPRKFLNRDWHHRGVQSSTPSL